MINFFRKIRRQLADDNKPLKYLRYAIGEIVLVVIGILIALQINNWNELRISQAKELGYLKRLREEFEANLIETERTLAASKKYKTLTEMLLKVFSNDTLVDAANLAMAVEWSSYGAPPTIKDNVWQDLVSSGNPDLISNIELRNTITEYYSLIALHWNLYRDNWVDDHNSTFDLTAQVLSWGDRKSVLNSFHSFYWGRSLEIPHIATDFSTILKTLKELPGIEAKLFTMYAIHDSHLGLAEDELSEIQTILELLQHEITGLH